MKRVLQIGVSFRIRDGMNIKITESVRFGDSQVQDFFEQWNIYRKVIDFNYMFHAEIVQILHKLFQSYFKCPFRLLDLGCGDAHTAYHSLNGTNIVSYTGVDLSAAALDFARENLKNYDFKKEFIRNDIFSVLDSLRYSYDVIQIGYSMHHLSYEDKRALLNKCSGTLGSKGVLVLYDVCRNDNETRDEYLVRYCNDCEQLWRNLDSSDLEHLYNHIYKCDFPESLNTLTGFVLESGFKKGEIMFRDHAGFHFLMCCYR